MQQLQALQDFFYSGATKSVAYRLQQLQALKKAVLQHEQQLYDALYKDLKKNKEEVWVTEIGFLISELNEAIRNLDYWMQPKTVSTNLANLPSKSYIQYEPLGVVLIIGPWNYPLQLLFTPLVGAIAAGNCVVLKPSEHAPETAAVLKKIVEEVFNPNYVLYVEGEGVTVVPQLLETFTFDHIFYTGSTEVGRIIYELAAKKLVPVTLELGGKSPCIVTQNANLEIAAKRIVVTKFSNCGQMCVAPDFILVHESCKEKFVAELKQKIESFYGSNPMQNEGYGKMINAKQFNRVKQYLSEGHILYGGDTNEENLYIQPTLIENVNLNNKIMQDEIFGPVLPILTYNTNEEALQIVKQHKNPLAFYIFSKNAKEQDYWLQQVPSGGACINNCSWHLTNHNLPFGGRGYSGIGKYHGQFSFETFSHAKAVLKTPTWFDPFIKYPPFNGRLWLFKKLIR
ncbi:MAG: aldehyde dehydrogenase [Chitinophagaceae bacterium]